MLGLIAVGANGFSRCIFGIIRRKEEQCLQKQQELLAQDRRFRGLTEKSSDGIVLVSSEGTILYASLSATRLLGCAVEELLGRRGLELIHPEDRGHALTRFSESLRHPGQSLRAQVRVRHQDGTWRWIEAVLSNLLTYPTVRALVGNFRDVTERKQAEEALRVARDELEARVQERTDHLMRANEALTATLVERQQAEASLLESRTQLAGIIGSAMEVIITIDEEQRIVLFNAVAERMFRVSAVVVIGQPVHRFIPGRFRPTHQAGIHEFGRTNVEKWWIGVLGGATALRADGEEFPIEAAVSQVEVGARKLYTLILRDITDRRRVEEELRTSREQFRALAGRLLSVREEERARIAKELHNCLGQNLTGLKLDLAWLTTRLPADQAALLERLRSSMALTDTAISAVRRIGTELRPGVLDDLGLVAALEWQAGDFQARTGVWCEFTAEPTEVPLDPEASTALFRICQEALANVARHAQARRVRITLAQMTGALVLTVTDDGRGITEQEQTHRTSLGLFGMRERARRLGGDAAIVGRPREGTTVTIRIPLVHSPTETASENRG